MKYITMFLLLLIPFNIASAAYPKVNELNTRYGYNIWYMEDKSLPIISFRMAFKKAGYAYDKKEKEGLAYFASMLLYEGYNGKNSVAFAKELDEKAISIEFKIDADNFYIEVKSLTENFDDAVQIVAKQLLSPNLSAETIAKIKQNIIVQQELSKQDPVKIGMDKLNAQFFGDNPLGNHMLGSKGSINSIDEADIKDYFASHLSNRTKLVMAASGDINPEKISAKIDEYFGKFSLIKENQADIPDFTAESYKISYINKDLAQSTIIFAFEGVKRQDDEFYAMLILNHIFGGGGFESRLVSELREKYGLAYGVSTGVNLYQDGSMIIGYLATKNEDAEKALAKTKEVIRDFAENPVTEEELALAKNYLTKSFPLMLDKNEDLSEILLNMQLYQLNSEFLNSRDLYINQVSNEEVEKLAAKILDPEKMQIVIIGNKK